MLAPLGSLALTAATALMAIVTQDQAPLRAAPRDSAPRQAVLWQGDALEVRGERQGFLQVWDHRRERAGYVRQEKVRTYPVAPESAPELLAVVRFLQDQPGQEALGLGYAALYLSAADPKAIGPDIFDAMGTFADRLARRASTRFGRAGDEAEAAHLEVAQAYGVKFQSFDRGGRTQVCADGEAYRRLLALGGTPPQRARAALALTRPECVDPALTQVDRAALDAWRAGVLDQVEPGLLPAWLGARVRLRRAEVWSERAFDAARKGERDPAREAGERAEKELAAVDRAELAEDDREAEAAAAARVGASRWAAGPVAGPAPKKGLALELAPGAPGETCVRLVEAEHPRAGPLATKCTFGVVWEASGRAAPHGRAYALAVQPLAGWRELWVFRPGGDGAWSVEVLVPAPGEPELGYLELAGWSPDGTRLLAARAARTEAGVRTSFEILRLDTLEVEKRAASPGALTPFFRWQSPEWKAGTVALR